MIKNNGISISFSKAKETLDKYRYKPRREWSKEEEFFLKYAISLFYLKNV